MRPATDESEATEATQPMDKAAAKGMINSKLCHL
jgi:hypothetical protein